MYETHGGRDQERHECLIIVDVVNHGQLSQQPIAFSQLLIFFSTPPLFGQPPLLTFSIVDFSFIFYWSFSASTLQTCSLMAVTDLKTFGVFIWFDILCCFYFCRLSHAVDTLGPGEAMQYNETLVSENGVFELGFFSSSSDFHYAGIWLKKDPYKKAVWVANREDPIVDSFGVLSIRHDGNLVMMDKRQLPIIVNYAMLATASNTTATLLDSGNLVLRGENIIIWESFYYPSDTFLPGMKIGVFNLGTDQKREQYIASWESPSAPAMGSFFLSLQSQNMTELKVWHGPRFSQTIGFWDGQSFKFLFESYWNKCNVSYVSNPHEVYLTFSSRENYSYSWFVLASTGEINVYVMTGEGISMVNYSLCQGTSPTNATDCFLMRPSTCPDEDTFSDIKGFLPNSSVTTEAINLGAGDCGLICRSNCSCIAYIYVHASSGNDRTGCKLYFGDKSSLLDIQREGNGTVYIRGETPTKTDYGRKRKRIWLFVVVPVASLVVLVILGSICYSQWRHKSCMGRKWKQDSMKRSVERLLFQLGTDTATTDEVGGKDEIEFSRKKDHELPLLSFSCIGTATDNFSATNKLGEGGFGPVYKGIFLGHEVAVKRLSKSSGQGLEEFKNEVQLICKLQHRNLVRLLGCCIQREEKILVYEYMPNRSLDSFLFDPTKKMLLNWEKRFCIIEGIAQGLLYLHKYSILRIIHRDLKTSNILLDEHMNPKISDFGMAKIFQEDQSRAKTTRVVGTYGYMSPEYAIHGLFSVKSDVFSFGVIMLEIISSKRNTAFYQQEHSLNLLEYAWNLWKGNRGMEFVDPALADTCSRSELMLCFEVGLLCVQENPEDRPTMSDVVSMLSNENSNLCPPKPPAFSTHTTHHISPSTRHQNTSLNDLTVSIIEAR